MATEQDPLLRVSVTGRRDAGARSHGRRYSLSALSKRYKNTCVTTRGGLVAMLWSVVVNTLGVGAVLFFTTTRPIVSRLPIFTASSSYYMVALLFYPVAALVSELRWTRFNSLLVASVIVGIGIVPFFVLLEIAEGGAQGYFYLIPVLFVVSGLALFQSNILQYGTDQLDFASSEVLSSFASWYYWTCYLIPCAMLLSWTIYTCFLEYDELEIVGSALRGVLVVVYLVLMCITVRCCCCHREVRMNHSDAPNNPVKLIWGVVLFAKKNKEHAFRSAFTYNEMPSRLDLAKQRYGGPYTTREVEDVKTFWQLFLLLMSLIGFQLRDDTTSLSLAIYESSLNSDDFSEYELYSSWSVTSLVIVVCIPFYQFVIRPFFPKFIPRMLTRMRIGLVMVILCLIAVTVIRAAFFSGLVVVETEYAYYLNGSDLDFCDVDACYGDILVNVSTTLSSFICPVLNHSWFYTQCNINNGCVLHEYSVSSVSSVSLITWLMVIPQGFNGLAHVLVFMTVLEFIFAQAPHSMQGLLIGLWYALQSINVGISVVEVNIFGHGSSAVCYWEYYVVKTVLVLLSFVLFIFASRKYEYRKLNEDIDINIHQEIEQAFERNFDREVEFEREQLQHNDAYIVESMD